MRKPQWLPSDPREAYGYDPRSAAVPCPYPAGSIERVEAMRVRVELGQSIWHPGDSTKIVINEDTAAERLRTLLAGQSDIVD